jgi:mannonate dehydratase
MSSPSRREYLQGTLGALAAAGAAAAAPAGTTEPRQTANIQLCEIFSPGRPARLRLARQSGVRCAIAGVTGTLNKVPRSQYADALGAIQREFEQAGLKIVGVESHPVPAEKIKLGLDGRDEEIENYIAAIEALAAVGIRMVCYNFMAGLGWYRTRFDLPERGGALVSEFNYRDAERQGLTRWGVVSEDKIWSNIEYFLKAVIPVAEKAGVQMALHPDDPPISPLRGIGRILTSAANYRRVLDIVPSPVNGITYCQANFKAMGEDIEALGRAWCLERKVFFVHYRDIEGTREHFRETFHDNGPSDMPRIMQAYAESGFRGPMRPDHAPTMEGESNENPGYAMIGKVFAFGYMKGILEALHIPHE